MLVPLNLFDEEPTQTFCACFGRSVIKEMKPKGKKIFTQ